MAQIHYISMKEYALKHGLHYDTVRTHIAAHRIPGVLHAGHILMIPEDAPLPRYGDMTQYEYVHSDYISLCLFSKIAGTSSARVLRFYQDGALGDTDTIMVDGRLLISAKCKLPPDRRLRSGKYIGWRAKNGKGKKSPDKP